MNTIDVMLSVADIISTGLDLDSDQIYLYNQKFIIPNDSRVYYAVSISSSKVFASSLTNEDRTEGFFEIVSENIQSTLNIDIFSRETLPIDKSTDVMAALRGTYSQQEQQRLGYYIALLPQNITPITEEEGAAILYRFNLPVTVQYFKVNEKTVEYYDSNQSEILLEE